jgi:hypothetical protein
MRMYVRLGCGQENRATGDAVSTFAERIGRSGSIADSACGE